VTVTRHPSTEGVPGEASVREAEDALAALESGEAAMLVPSVVSATAAVLVAFTNPGGHVIASRETHGSLRDLLLTQLPGLGRTVSLVDCADPDAVGAAVEPATQVVYAPSLTDPLMRPCPLNDLATYAQMNDLLLVVDNTGLSPAQARPLEAGAVVVIEDAQPYLDGFGDLRAAAVTGGRRLLHRVRAHAARNTAEVDPWTARLLTRSLAALELRMAAHDRNATLVAAALRGHPAVHAVHRPSLEEFPWAHETHQGFGGLLSFEVAPEADLDRVLAACSPASGPAVGPGTTASLPATGSHAHLSERARRAAGITRRLVRLAVGTEDVSPLIRNLRRALDAAPLPRRAALDEPAACPVGARPRDEVGR
jgi:cystathionine beta-lyase/cystathionine gamma-synthase